MDLPSGPDLDAKVVRRLGDWIAHFEKQGHEDLAQTVREIKEEVEGQAPF
jgi:hypothetical protein